MSFQSQLAQTLETVCLNEGLTATHIPGLQLYRCNTAVSRKPAMYAPTICVIAQGHKQIYMGDRTCRYDADNYLISSISMPLEVEIGGVTPETPYLGFSLDIDQHIVAQLLIDMEQAQASSDKADHVLVSTEVTESLLSSFLRLLGCAGKPMDIHILSTALKREIYYEVLKGPYGEVLRNCVANHTGANRISPAMHYIEQNFQTALDIDSIAKYAGMSTSSLHDHFKQVTSMSPMQYVKRLRLHRAHSLLLSGTQASEASYHVGYNSPSQFSREFKRFFGESPREIQAAIGR